MIEFSLSFVWMWFATVKEHHGLVQDLVDCSIIGFEL